MSSLFTLAVVYSYKHEITERTIKCRKNGIHQRLKLQ